ncbi:MAG: 2-C-methyl-D-erythritol 4-phosphate cytidylyltransferase [Syntrophomonadales bacterium]
MGDTGVILAAAGQGKRMGSRVNKVLLSLTGQPIIKYSLDVFEMLPDVEEIIVVAHPREVSVMEQDIVKRFEYRKVRQIVPGGRERQDSVWAGLKALDNDLHLVAVHDGARPLVSPELALRVIETARVFGAACPGVPCKDTLKKVGADGRVETTLDRSQLYQIQTPQVFEVSRLREAYRQAFSRGFSGTDDAVIYEEYCGPVQVVEGDYRNLKITTEDDMYMAQGILSRERAMRVGNGYDVHRLVEGRKLVIGGVRIPFEKGLAGHSDADVLVHAVCDALLGAAGLRDIGFYFPDSDPKFHNIDSLILLKRVGAMVSDQGLEIVNIDSTVIGEQPKIAPYLEEMRRNLAAALGIEVSRVNIKATTTEGLGFTGRGEGIAAQASVLLSGGSRRGVSL